MRYWIWWNDLIQGPFEVDELAALRSFSEDLLVCQEDREEWIPVGRVADLSPSLEQQKITRARPIAPPPPPPTRPPAVSPLQGEFFGEPPGQQSLLKSDDEPKGPYAYRSATDDPGTPSGYFDGQVTNPFHFSQSPRSSVIAMPRQRPQKIEMIPQAIVKESPVPKEVLPEPVALQVLHEETAENAPSPSLAPTLGEPMEVARKPEWLPWLMGIVLAIAALGSMGYWLLDRVSTHSAITEANRMEPPRPLSLPPATPLPAPVVKTSPVVRVKKKISSIKKFVAKKISKHERAATAPSLPTVPPVPPAPVAVAAPSPAPVPSVPVPSADIPVVAKDLWAGRQNDAIRRVMAKTLPKSKVTVGEQAKTMLQQMHEKELMHASETGERLYLPDKMAWAALQEEGPRYRVYLNFLAMQANGERVQARSYQFIIDLKAKTIQANDPATQQDLLTQNAELNFKHNPMATDIDSILGGVDTYNKHKVQMIIIKKNRSNKEQRTKIETAMKTAQGKIQRSIIYFRRTYPDKALQNVAKAYNFVELLKG